MNSFKKQCIQLRKKDKTLNEIVLITGRSKTSVWFHIKDIQLSLKKKKEIGENSGIRAIAVADARRGISKREFKTFEEWTPNLALLVAHLIFDGELSKNRCGYTNRSKTLIARVERLFEPIYSYEPKRYVDERSGVHSIYHHNVALAHYLKNKADELLTVISELSIEHQKEFIRAFFDDEGCMDYRPARNKRCVRGYQKDRKVLILVKKLLSNFDIESVIREPNEVVITKKDNLIKFQKEINFSKGVCPNPNRSNSLRKQEIEKREILDQAIKSFKT
jgi:hypothetical protein